MYLEDSSFSLWDDPALSSLARTECRSETIPDTGGVRAPDWRVFPPRVAPLE